MAERKKLPRMSREEIVLLALLIVVSAVFWFGIGSVIFDKLTFAP